MWVNKYAPQHFHSVIGNEDIVKRFKLSSEAQYIQHMILYGPSGVGKNTILTLLMKKLLGEHYDEATMIFSSADNKNNQTIREKIHQFAPMHITSGKKKFIVFKQSEQLSEGVQQIMRRLMEKHYHNTIFVFVCNSMNNMLETIQSRCHIFKFQQVSILQQVNHLKYIAQKENIIMKEQNSPTSITDCVCTKIAKMSQGDVRFCINYFQAVCNTVPIVGDQKILENSRLIQTCFFPYYDDIHNIITLLSQPTKNIKQFIQCVNIIKKLSSCGYCGLDITFFFE